MEEQQPRTSYGSQRFGLWCSWIFAALTVIGWLGIANFYKPEPADNSAEQIRQWFTDDHRWGIIIGCTIFYIAAGILVPASIQFGLMLSKIEGRRPLWSFSTGVCGIFISLIIFFNCCAWITAAYREENGGDVVQAWYDWAWFAFLLGWIYLSIEMLSTAVVELADKRAEPMVPRWMTWLTIAGSVTLMTAAGPAFFKSGPFAYNGLLGYYVPMVIWGFYLVGTAWFMLKELEREEAAERAGAPAPTEPSPTPVG